MSIHFFFVESRSFMQDNKLELFKTHNPLETLSCSFIKKRETHASHSHTYFKKPQKELWTIPWCIIIIRKISLESIIIKWPLEVNILKNCDYWKIVTINHDQLKVNIENIITISVIIGNMVNWSHLKYNHWNIHRINHE